jgi:AsmA protein
MKWIVRSATALVVLIIITIFLAPSLISKDMVRKKLVQQIEQNTGRKLEIDGAVNVQFLPFPKVEATNVSLSGPAEFADRPFISIKSLEVNVALLPLISKEIVITKLHLNGADVNLEVNAQGEDNWSFTPKSKPGRKQATTANLGGRAALPNIMFGDVHLSNSTIAYRDLRTSKVHELKQVNLSLDAENIHEPVSINADAILRDKKITLSSQLGSLVDLYENRGTDFSLLIANDVVNVDYKGRVEAMTFKGNLSVDSNSLTELFGWLEPAKQSAAIDQKLALNLSSKVDCTLDSCFFKNLNMTLDAVKVSGEASFNLSGRKPEFNLDLSADALDLNPFLPKHQAGTQQSFSIISSAHAAPAKSWSSDPIDLSVFDRFNATINIKTGSFVVQSIKTGLATLRAKVENGRFSADIIDAVFYGGKATISANVDSRAMTVSKRVELSAVQAEPFMSDVLQEKRLSGTLNSKAAFFTRGGSESEMVANLQGQGSVKFTDGAIRGINLADMVRNIQSAFKQVDTAPQKTDFAELGGTFTIANGILKNNDLAMKAPLMRLSGDGQINLPARTINYRLKPQIVETIQGQGGKEKEGIMVPVIVEGSLDNPSFRPDLASAAQDALRDPQKIKDTVKNVKEQLKEGGLKDAVKDVRGILKGF